ncbi:hypothetical protein MKEN_00412100 [Mycena kentingensis (nom. inval.)]|nr:hypothetical protein MKEN_00412100 [Mycena kentingensis (nom. inval.)]
MVNLPDLPAEILSEIFAYSRAITPSFGHGKMAPHHICTATRRVALQALFWKDLHTVNRRLGIRTSYDKLYRLVKQHITLSDPLPLRISIAGLVEKPFWALLKQHNAMERIQYLEVNMSRVRIKELMRGLSLRLTNIVHLRLGMSPTREAQAEAALARFAFAMPSLRSLTLVGSELPADLIFPCAVAIHPNLTTLKLEGACHDDLPSQVPAPAHLPGLNELEICELPAGAAFLLNVVNAPNLSRLIVHGITLDLIHELDALLATPAVLAFIVPFKSCTLRVIFVETERVPGPYVGRGSQPAPALWGLEVGLDGGDHELVFRIAAHDRDVTVGLASHLLRLFPSCMQTVTLLEQGTYPPGSAAATYDADLTDDELAQFQPLLAYISDLSIPATPAATSFFMHLACLTIWPETVAVRIETDAEAVFLYETFYDVLWYGREVFNLSLDIPVATPQHVRRALEILLL